MQVGQFPAAAADSLIEGYCDDFVALAAILAQTLEQVSIRGIDCRRSRPALERIERGMRDLADAIHDLLQRGAIAQGLTDRLKTGQSGDGALDALCGTGGAPMLLAPDPPPAPPSPSPPARSAQPAERFTAIRTDAWFSMPGASGAPGRPGNGGPGVPGGSGGSERQRVADIGHPPPQRPAPWLGEQRPPQRNEAAPKAGPGLRGTASSLPVLSVFQFLGRMRKTGVMKIELRDEALTFEFANGCVQGCTSSARLPNERLGALLYELGACTHDQMVGLVAQFDEHTSEQIGAAAIREGIASNGQVLEALELQVRRRFKRACAAPEARYDFAEGKAGATDGRMRIAPTELAFEPDPGGRA